MNSINIAILGIGTVGGGTYKIIENQKSEFLKKIGSNINIKKILVKDKNKYREGIKESLITDDWNEIINDDSIHIIVEVMGGIEPAKSYIIESLERGKSVVTANKDLISSYGNIILNIAKKNNCDILFEAAVAGGIPIIRPLKQCLAGNNIREIVGIINGTTNFILTKMTDSKMSFNEALEIAKELGYAEAEPSSDIEGFDSARKLAIMSSIAFNSRVSFENVYVEGITNISLDDIEYAKELGCCIKLVGIANNFNNEIEVRVHPVLIPNEHPLSNVKNSFNAICVKGDFIGDAMFFGNGAGELPTASAIVGDIIDIIRNINFNCCGRINCTCYRNIAIKSIDNVYSKYFVRMQIFDRPGILAKVLTVFAKNSVGIYQMLQKNKRDNGYAEIVIVTDKVKEEYINKSINDFNDKIIVKKIDSIIRVY